jgi:hypothetical protein
MKHKHYINKIAAIFIFTMISLAASSASYALWYENLHLDVDAETGYVEWIFGNLVTVTDTDCPPPYHPTMTPDYIADPNIGLYDVFSPYIGEKNVGCGMATLVDDHHIELIIYNAYPGYCNHIDFWILNTGTIPLVIDSVTIWDEYGNEIITFYSTGVHEFDINDDGFNDMQILWGHPFGEPGAQVHEWERRDISFGFCFLQPLPQDETIVLKLGLLAVQYNEWQSPAVGPVYP